MRRDSLSLEVTNVGWLEAGGEPRQPTLVVGVDDGTSALHEHLGGAESTGLDAGDVDVTFRFRQSADDEASDGVMAITNRLTGEFLLELTVEAADVMEFVAAARRYAERTEDAARYRTTIEDDDGTLADFEKRTLLVYASDGELLRQHSLIPSGVEI